MYGINRDTKIELTSSLKADLELDNHDIRSILNEIERVYGLELGSIMTKITTIEDIINLTNEIMLEKSGDEGAEKLLKDIIKN